MWLWLWVLSWTATSAPNFTRKQTNVEDVEEGYDEEENNSEPILASRLPNIMER